MKLLNTIQTAIVALSSVAAASDGFVQLDILPVKHSNSSYVAAKLNYIYGEEAAGSIQVPTKYIQVYYFADVGVGSNNQRQQLLVDTGSSDFWVQTTLNSQCTQECQQQGIFDESQSSTFHNNYTTFYILYGNGQIYSLGLWGQETATIGSGLTVEKANIAFANNSNIEWGLLGVGYAGLESTYNQQAGTGTIYANFPVQLKQQGKILKSAYSLYLNTDSTSNILFGGIDKAKYTGEVSTIDILKLDSVYDFVNVELDSISVNVGGSSGTSTTANTDQSYILDSGTPFIVLPTDAAAQILNLIQPGATFDFGQQAYIVDCSLINDANYLTFNFKGAKTGINVPLSEVIGQDGNTCTFQVPTTDNGGGILGAPFLRHSYTTFDLDDNQVSLAQVKYTSDTDIVAIQ